MQKQSNIAANENFNKSKIDNNNVELLWLEIQQAYQQHNIDKAYQLLQSIDTSIQLDQTQQTLKSTIIYQYQLMIKFYSMFQTQGWIFDKVDNGITIQYKYFDKEIGIKIQGQFQISIQRFMVILYEIDLMHNYIPFSYDTFQLKLVKRNHKIGSTKIYIPLLSDRQTYFHAVGYDRIKTTNSIFIYSRTINNDHDYLNKYQFIVPQESKYVRMDYKFFIIEYIPISQNKGKIRLALNIDLKMNYIPNFVINKTIRQFALRYFKNILKINKKFQNSDWQKKINQKPQFYKFFQKKISQLYKKS